VADTLRAGIATAETADTAVETSATTAEDMVATSPDRPPMVEGLKVDLVDTVVATATAGPALDLASPMPQVGVAITVARTATQCMAARQRITRQW